ncbi:MAG: hypothetical protein AUJ71_01165 [Candidatus Omnitrophica bacterium CG1_02_49_16]|nr:MAG: hypothetical protein AUJ71_01165 [Candidatus Omnitrophica bacterium CG1_02_49_16]
MASKKKIAFISTMESTPWGGSEELWSRTAEHFLSQGYPVSANVKGFGLVPEQLDRLRAKGCEITFRRPPVPQSLRVRAINRFFPHPMKHPDGAWLDAVKPDLVVISQGGSFDGVTWMLECKKRSIRCVTITHSAHAGHWPSDRLAASCSEAYKAAAACFFVSNANRAMTQWQLAADLSQAEIIRNPFNVSYDVAPPWPLVDPRYRLACVARLEPPSKGHDLLFEVMNMKKWRDRPLEVVLYGSGLHEMNLKNLKKYLNLTHVVFAGFTDRVEGIWSQCHGLILASRVEGLPLALVEAMLCGRVVIATDIGGNAEVIEDNVSGFIAKEPSVRLIDEALERAWQRRDEWEEMGKNGAKRIRELVPRDPTRVFYEKLLTHLNPI